MDDTSFMCEEQTVRMCTSHPGRDWLCTCQKNVHQTICGDEDHGENARVTNRCNEEHVHTPECHIQRIILQRIKQNYKINLQIRGRFTIGILKHQKSKFEIARI